MSTTTEREANRLITVTEMRNMLGFKSTGPIERMREDPSCPIKFVNLREDGKTKNQWRVWLHDVLDYIEGKSVKR